MADAIAAGDHIPYLGPDPAPSRAISPTVKIAAAVTALCWMAAAVFELRVAALAGDVGRRRGSELLAEIHTHDLVVRRLLVVAASVWIVELVAVTVWRRRRRPGRVLRERGETYVESPLVRAANWRLRYPVLAVWVGTVVSMWLGSAAYGPSNAATLLGARRYLALGFLFVAGFSLIDIARVVLAEREHRERLDTSRSRRQAPEAVPFVPPVTERQVVRALRQARRR